MTIVIMISPCAFAQDGSMANPAPAPAQKAPASAGDINIPDIIFSHVLDSYEWHILTWKGHPVAIYLPVIVHSKTTGWHIFSSKHLEEGEYEGFFLAPSGEKYENKVVERGENGALVRPLDLSITKNVLSLMIGSLLLLIIVLLTARWYKKHDALNEAPSGIAAVMEPIIMMVHNIAKENIGEDYKKYSPYLLMAFCFIFLNNLLGIVPIFPGGANLTGNIACTMVLALLTFFITNVNGTKHYYKEMFNPDVPVFLKPIMPVIEVFSAIMKPVSLTIRLFANMLAGHIQLSSVVCIIFIMAKYGAVLFGSMSLISVLFGIFLDVLEILISFIQAYVFTMLSSIYIGIARQKN